MRLRRAGACLGRPYQLGLVWLALAATQVWASADPKTMFSVSPLRIEDAILSADLRNDSGRIMHPLDERAWNRKNYVKVGLWTTSFLEPAPVSSDTRPDLDGVLGAVRWIDLSHQAGAVIQPNESLTFSMNLPASAGLARLSLVVLSRAGEEWRTEIVPLPAWNRLHVAFVMLFACFFALEALLRRATLSPPGPEPADAAERG